MAAIIWDKIFYYNFIVQKQNLRVVQENDYYSSSKTYDNYKTKLPDWNQVSGMGLVSSENKEKLPLIKRWNLINKENQEQEEIKKSLWSVNNNWNDRKLQLHWSNLEWVDTKTLNLKTNSFCT